MIHFAVWTTLEGGELLNRLKQIEAHVEDILFHNPDARDNDNLLFAEYLKVLNQYDFIEVAETIKRNNLVTIMKTVERARRKLQQHNEDLRGEVWRQRHKAQDEFIQYSKD